jgi:fumarate hydratase class II
VKFKFPPKVLGTNRTIRNNFKIGPPSSIHEIIEGFLYLKKSMPTLIVIQVFYLLKSGTIATVCDEILNGDLKMNSPRDLAGSGTQSNMNVNEVIANRAQVVKGKEIGVGSIYKANDDV